MAFHKLISITDEQYSFCSAYRSSFSSFSLSFSYINQTSYADSYAHIINPFVLVNGYGVDLI